MRKWPLVTAVVVPLLVLDLIALIATPPITLSGWIALVVSNLMYVSVGLVPLLTPSGRTKPVFSTAISVWLAIALVAQWLLTAVVLLLGTAVEPWTVVVIVAELVIVGATIALTATGLVVADQAEAADNDISTALAFRSRCVDMLGHASNHQLDHDTRRALLQAEEALKYGPVSNDPQLEPFRQEVEWRISRLPEALASGDPASRTEAVQEAINAIQSLNVATRRVQEIS